MKKRGFAIFFLIVVTIVLLWGARERYHERHRNQLVVENRSGQAIAQLRITITRETILFENVADGAEVAAPFRIGADDHFVVAGRLADGSAIGGNFGYVTNGMAGERARFRVGRGGAIDFDQDDNIPLY